MKFPEEANPLSYLLNMKLLERKYSSKYQNHCIPLPLCSALSSHTLCEKFNIHHHWAFLWLLTGLESNLSSSLGLDMGVRGIKLVGPFPIVFAIIFYCIARDLVHEDLCTRGLVRGMGGCPSA